jgi:hypothetical protein
MLDIAQALREDDVMRSLTGLKVRQFEELHKKFDAELLSRKLVAKPKRQRALGGLSAPKSSASTIPARSSATS